MLIKKIKNDFLILPLWCSLSCLLSLLMSCKNDSQNNFENKFYHQNFISWSTTYHLEFIHPQWALSEKVMNGPDLVWTPLVRVDTLGNDQFTNVSYCVIYRFPGKNINAASGEIRVLSIKKSEKCEANVSLIEKSNNYLSGILQLQWIFTTDKEKKMGGNIIPPFHWAWFIEMYKDEDSHEKKQEFLLFPLYNIRKHFPPKRFSSPLSHQLLRGVTLFSPRIEDVVGEHISQNSGSWDVGDKSELWLKCYERTPDGKVLLPYSCEKCRYGHFPAITKKGVAQFCGVNHCGERLHPACIRSPYRGGEAKLACISGSPWGYCQAGYEASCDGNGVLICL